MQWLKNIWWLLTEAPTELVAAKEDLICDYCGTTEGGIQKFSDADFCICQRCMKNAFDMVLKDGCV